MAAWVYWHGKCKKIEFYHDKEEHTFRPKRLRKPQKSKYESDELYKGRVDKWEAALPHDQIVKPQGNLMTQKYYTKRLLPVYAKTYREYRLQRAGLQIFQEDNNPSHSH